MTAVTVNSQSLLAKLLATENITVQHTPGIKTAMFDLKNRVLMLPIWEDISTDLKHLLIGHETGHALDSPDADTYAAAIKTIASNVFGNESVSDKLMKTVRGFLNVVEDVRIDKRQKRRYPGLRKNYLLGYKELIDRDFFGTKNRDINSMNFIDRLNLYFKGGSIHYDIQFTPAERSLLKRVENIETFGECIEITEEVYRYCKDKLENDNFEDDLVIHEPTDEEGDEWSDDYSNDASNEENENDRSDDADYDDTDGGSIDTKDTEDGGKSEPKAGERGEGDIQPEGGKNGASGAGDQEETVTAPEAQTDNVWQDKIQSLVKDEKCKYVYLDMPDVDWKKAVHDYKKVLSDWRASIGQGGYWSTSKEDINYARTQMTEWRQKERDAISYLVKEFEQRKSAEIYSRISIAKTGVIDTNKLHSYKYNDDIFRRLSVIPEGKNHGFVMFLDWSGSMDCCLKETMKQLFTLVLFCKQIQVPFEVYTFKDSNAEDPWLYDNKVNALALNHVVLRQVLSSKMTLTELNEAFTILWHLAHRGRMLCEGLGGTPLNDALILAPKVVNDFRAKYKLEIVNCIVMTDGESNGFSGVKNESAPNGPYQIIGGVVKPTRYLYSDAQTGKTYDLHPFGWGDQTISNTNVLLSLLKEKTGCNLIGFYLWNETWYRFLGRFNIQGNPDYHRSVSKFWKDNKFYPVKSAGYDEYYVIDVKALRNTSNDLTIDNTKTTKQMAKAFSKFAAKKSVNRVLLRQFINNVTNQAKKLA